MAAEVLRALVAESEAYPQGTPIRDLVEKPAQEIAHFREVADSLPTPKQFINQERERLSQKGFTDSNVEFPSEESLDQVFEAWKRAVELGFIEVKAHVIVGMDLENIDLPRGWVRVQNWYRQQIGKTIDKDAAILEPAYVLVDTTPKPKYDGGRQLYPNDSLGPMMSLLREDGKIIVPDDYKHVPQTSRFAVTPQERETSFNPAFAQVLKVDPSQVRVPTAAENNFLGNIHHPEFGQNNTWEWYDDHFGGDSRLFGGCSDGGGLARVFYDWSGGRIGSFGFRPLVVFSS